MRPKTLQNSKEAPAFASNPTGMRKNQRIYGQFLQPPAQNAFQFLNALCDCLRLNQAT